MNNDHLTEDQLANLHSAGAIVRHQNPFSDFPTPLNSAPMSDEIREKWVIPFYMRPLEAQHSDFTEACIKATPELARCLLGEFNWRPRVVGARFVAIRHFSELQKDISNLLLKSEVCYAGSEYCLALASLGNASAADTLSTYLDYYLSRPDLWFDQGAAMAALIYLDESLGSSRAASFIDQWQFFTSNKPYMELADYNEWFRRSIASIEGIRRIIATAN